MKPFLFFLFSIGIASNTHAQANDQEYKDSLAYATVETLPEIVHMIQEDERLHKGSNYTFMSQIHLTMKAKPTVDTPRYWIQVLRSKDTEHWPGGNDEVVYNFIVYPARNTIYYYDTKVDSAFTLTEWRHKSDYAIPSMK